MAFHKTLISRVTQTCVVSPIGPRANFLFGRYQQESRANGTKGDADTLGGYLESLLGTINGTQECAAHRLTRQLSILFAQFTLMTYA